MLPVLKRAKTSETQRLIKKVKFLRKKVEDGGDAAQSAKQEVLDLEQQLDIIKVGPVLLRHLTNSLILNSGITAARIERTCPTSPLAQTAQAPPAQAILTSTPRLFPRTH